MLLTDITVQQSYDMNRVYVWCSVQHLYIVVFHFDMVVIGDVCVRKGKR